MAGRYDLVDLLGTGGFGAVYRARDRMRGEDVALKLIPIATIAALGDLRREVTALRWLRLPGVVGFRDDGIDEQSYFLAMDLVEGVRFPGTRVREWQAIEAVVHELLAILARVHLAGVLHLDLKPANVLVSRDGHPVILDFGLARGIAVDASPDTPRIQGTPQYVAPEVLSGRIPDGRADLYAAGVMIFEALTGAPPHSAQRLAMLFYRRASEPAPALLSVCPGAPAHVARVVDGLLATEPELRPVSALDALEALGGRSPAPLTGALPPGLRGEGRLTEPELREVFAGPDAFLHLREDAAAVLWERTCGERGRVAEELAAWIRAGRATWEGDLLRVDRLSIEALRSGALVVAHPGDPEDLDPSEAFLLGWVRQAWPDGTLGVLEEVSGLPRSELERVLDRLKARDLAWDLPNGRIGAWPVLEGGSPRTLGALPAQHIRLAAALPVGSEARLRHLVSGRAEPREVVAEARLVSSDLARRGLLGPAMEALRLAMDLVQSVDGTEDEELEILQDLAVLALVRETAAATDVALCLVGRSRCRGAEMMWLETLLRSARALYEGGGLARALEEVEQIPPLDHEDLEMRRQAIRMTAANRLDAGRAEAILPEVREWAERGPALRAAMVDGWEGNLRYAQNRFEEAARLHLSALRGKTRRYSRLSTLINAASALIEVPALSSAMEMARHAVQLARVSRLAGYEIHSVWVERTVAYRDGSHGPARPDLVRAAACFDEDAAARLGINEAAVAWRNGDHALAADLAAESAARFWGEDDLPGRALAVALEAVARGGVDEARLAALAGEIEGCRVPDIEVQVLGMLRMASSRPDPTWAERARRVARCRPPSQWGMRLDVLSFEESLAMA